MPDPSDLKNIARQFLMLTATVSLDEACARFVAHDFIHHNQYFKGDRQSLQRAMQVSAVSMPGKKIVVISALQEGDRVMTYSHIQMQDDTMDTAAFHMSRGGKIAELWDLAQQAGKDMPNENGLF